MTNPTPKILSIEELGELFNGTIPISIIGMDEPFIPGDVILINYNYHHEDKIKKISGIANHTIENRGFNE